MDPNEVYKIIFSELIKSKIKIFGKLAIKKVSEIPDIVFDDEGNVSKFTGDSEKILSQIISKFEELAGKPSTIASKMLIKRIAKDHPGFTLPNIFN